ncbi:FAD-dependent monooxygenase [Bacillus sp. FJAT-45066]|uniref:FAD-dependent monooxygenase n=1 Tax=Bacillus sp. FJAT-45066 TaxID=2011010 RepID=UPI000BB912A9|nr:FAD-dependent monooxygenase [Bacillus sp. FJAT-45066]
MQKKALVIGAGIGGLCTAIALQQKGWNVSIWEKSNKLSGLGAGIVLAPNALYALELLGVAKKVREQGSPVKDAHILSSDGKKIITLPTDLQAKKHGTYSYLIHRGILQNILLEKINDNIELHLNKELKQLKQTEQKVTAIASVGYEEDGNILIGADGIHSKVREFIFGPSPLRYSGYTALRGVCQLDMNTPGNEEGGFEAWGRGKRFGFTKIGEGKYFWFAAVNSSEGKKLNLGERKEAALHFLKDWCHPIEEVIQATSESDILHHDIYDRRPLSTWSEGRVTLLGDAAHPMLPNLGQGGAQAMEDAIVLAHTLEKNPANRAFQEYEEKRIPRTTKIVNQSRKMARLVQMESQIMLRTRNTLFRNVSAALFASRMNWVVGYKVKKK